MRDEMREAFSKAFKEYRFSGGIIEADAEHFWQARGAYEAERVKKLERLLRECRRKLEIQYAVSLCADIDKALGGHGFATVTSTQVGALYNEPPETLQYTRDELVEIAESAYYLTHGSNEARIEAMLDALLATGQLKVRVK